MFEGNWKIAIGEDPIESPGTFLLSAGEFTRGNGEFLGRFTVDGDQATIVMKDQVNDLDQPYSTRLELRRRNADQLDATIETIIDGGEPLYEDAVFTRIPVPAEAPAR